MPSHWRVLGAEPSPGSQINWEDLTGGVLGELEAALPVALSAIGAILCVLVAYQLVLRILFPDEEGVFWREDEAFPGQHGGWGDPAEPGEDDPEGPEGSEQLNFDHEDKYR